jgi:hypothetical protein
MLVLLIDARKDNANLPQFLVMTVMHALLILANLLLDARTLQLFAMIAIHAHLIHAILILDVYIPLFLATTKILALKILV